MYYLLLNGTQTGPFSLEQLKSYWKEGHVDGTTLYCQEGMSEWQPLQTIQHLIDVPSERVISGFWRRLGAYTIDCLILGIVGITFGTIFFAYLAQIGAWGLLIGLTVGLCYFGILNSRIGKGQTLGKRLLGVETVNREGNHLSPLLSFPRYLIFATPFYLNGLVSAANISPTSPLALALGFIFLTGGWAIAYLFVFNRRTRQSLHDLIVGSFVVRTLPEGSVKALPVWWGHWMALGLSVVALAGLGIAMGVLVHFNFLQNLLAVNDGIRATGKVTSVGITEGFHWSSYNGKTSTSKVLAIQFNWKIKPDDQDKAATEMAAIILDRYPEASQDNVLNITMVYGYNIGIASSFVSQTISHSPAQWQRLIADSASNK